MYILAVRLLEWGRERGWTGGLRGIRAGERAPGRSVAFDIGPVTGFGRTTNEAVSACADQLAAEHGWPDDRGR